MYDLVIRTERRDDLLVSDRFVIASYTLDYSYVSSYQVYYGETKVARKIQPLGSVLAFDPYTRKVVPNFSSYQFEAVGVLLKDELVQFGDKAVDVVYSGDINEKAVWDDGVYQGLLDTTRSILTNRINFIDVDGLAE